MKYIIKTFFAIFLLVFTSCNQSKIENLEYEVSKLEKENATLKSQIEELENVISNYKSYTSRYSYEMEQRERHQQNAQEHLRTAEFWRQSGNEFIYESNMRNAQQELDMIP